ncbi:hypothetical protein BOX15_Mlig021045g1 [Macrostomum lignano]|uniref:GRAM domain-containing protein n=1 Tax=Macrostomum lignano TaxID=282301 RepID=A0A267FAU8_9PLAT|nr:hypothetical protein BOX15_Mlig021045g1 [Macrostomum lignano]
MSINKAHATGGGVVLFYGERLLIFYDGCEVQLKFDNQPQLSTTSKGSVFLTSHRTICLCKSGQVHSMSMPLLNMKQVEVKQPIFGANRIEGKATPEPDGGFTGMAHFSVTFNKGGAIEFAQCLLEAGRRANANRHGFQAPPPYSAYDPTQLYCPPPAQYAAEGPNYGFVPCHDAFGPPPPNYVYMTPAPPPYPGAAPPPPYPGPQQQQQQPPYPPQQQSYPPVQSAYYSGAAPHQAAATPSAPPPAYEEKQPL